MTASTLVFPRCPVAWRPIAFVFLPFAAGYYLTYLFRSINALIANRLTADLGLGAADIGLLTSVFFLSLAAVQLPLGILLDRYGPRRVQIMLLPIAAFGALLFGSANSFPTLMIARALIGIGVAGSLMSGLKAIVLWFTQERIPLANGCFITIGALRVKCSRSKCTCEEKGRIRQRLAQMQAHRTCCPPYWDNYEW